MIQIFVNNGTTPDEKVLVFDSRLEAYDLLALSRTGGLNKGGTATITMPPGHPAYNLFVSYRSIVEIYRDERLLFRGRALYPADNYNNERTITCEGELCFLRDASPHLYSGTYYTSGLFSSVVNKYNSKVEEFKQFEIGEVTVQGHGFLELEPSDSALDVLNKMVENFGGYIVFTTGDNGRRVINWYEQLTKRNNQTIEFGENLLDFARDGVNTDMCTAVLAFGAKRDEANGWLWTESIDDAAAAIRGTIYHYPVWDDITDQAALQKKAKQYLEEHRYYIETLKLTAMDLSRMDKTLDCFYEGDIIRVKSAPHAVDEDFHLTEMDEDLLSSKGGSITLGKKHKTLTSSTVAGENRTEQIIRKYAINSSKEVQAAETRLSSKIEQTSESVLLEVSKSYATQESLASSIEQLADTITLEVSGGLGNAAAIRLNVNGEAYTETLDLSQVRAAFAQDTTSILLEAGTITFNSGTIVINSSYFTLDSSGNIKATGGTIGGWTLSGYKLYAGDGKNTKTVVVEAPGSATTYVFAAGGKSHDDYGDCPFRVTKAGKLYATDAVVYGDIITIDGSYKTEMDRGSLRLYYDDALCGTINTKYWSGASTEGICLRIEEQGSYVMFCSPNADMGTGYQVDYYLNYGWSSNYDEKHIFQTSARFLDDVYFAGYTRIRSLRLFGANGEYLVGINSSGALTVSKL